MRIFGAVLNKQLREIQQFRPAMPTVSFHSFALVHAGCGPVIANTLRSRGYPNDYPNNTDCISSFPIPQDMMINITISELYLEDSKYCE